MKNVYLSMQLVFVLGLILFVFAGCSQDDDDSDNDGEPDDDDQFDDDNYNRDDDDDNDEEDTDDDSSGPSDLEDLIDRMGFSKYLEIEPISKRKGANGYTRYYFDTDDVRCFTGGQANVGVSPGTSNNVMLFLEGGGAAWPGGGLCFQADLFWDIGVKTRDPENPVSDWNFVYVPYCDCSLHCGDNELKYDGKMRYHHGVRHTAAAVALMKKLFPNPDKVLVAGSSAGGYGTYYAWLIAKSLYMDTDTYVFNDSGTGFWNPEDPETFKTIKEAWNLFIPDDCTLCVGTVFTGIYDTYLRYDPQVRIGMFTAYYDSLITGLFIGIDPELFKIELLSITGKIKANYPNRFNRFFIDTTTHTSYELEWFDFWPGNDYFLAEGPRYELDGTSLFEWMGYLVEEDPEWRDLLE